MCFVSYNVIDFYFWSDLVIFTGVLRFLYLQESCYLWTALIWSAFFQFVFVSLSCLIAVAKISSTILNNSSIWSYMSEETFSICLCSVLHSLWIFSSIYPFLCWDVFLWIKFIQNLYYQFMLNLYSMLFLHI